MRWMKVGLSSLAAGALALASCSSQENGSNSSDKGGGAMTGGGQDAPTPSNLTEDPQNGIQPVTLPSPKAITSIPAAYRGHWGAVVTDCEAGHATAEGSMVIGASDVRFTGSRAALRSLSMLGAATLTAEFSYSGGKTGTRANRLTLVDDGRTLVRQEQQNPSLFRYSRCPA